MKYRITISEQTTYEVEAEGENEAYVKAHDFNLDCPADGVKVTHQETNTTEGPELVAQPEVETHLGLGEYEGQEHVYDGHVTACESGAVEDVISYLNELKDFIPAGEVSLTWQGSNGLWFAGSEAIEAIDAELDRITGKTEED